MAQRDRPKAPDPSPTDDAVDAPTILAEPVAVDVPAPEEAIPGLSAPAPSPNPPPRGVFLPALGGGVLAAAIGFGLSQFNVLGLGRTGPDLSILDQRLSAVEAAVAQISADLAQVRDRPVMTDPALADRISALEAAGTRPVADPRLDGLVARMDALEAQLADAAAAGTGASGAALAALQAEVRALKSAAPAASEDLSALVAETKASLAEAESRAQALVANADALAKSAALTAALGQLRAAMESGQPFSATLAQMKGVDVPKPLADQAESGVPTLASLRDGFPVAARAALDAALRANPGDTWTDRVSTFLRSQTGARSVTPRDGSDPDAVLSRAEAALAAGKLESALQEISTLPDAARAAMADWVSLAERRRAAAAAVDTLAGASGG
ncbi:MAG: hypothetical protein V4516_03285 [Pseudomonadota bacterium]